MDLVKAQRWFWGSVFGVGLCACSSGLPPEEKDDSRDAGAKLDAGEAGSESKEDGGKGGAGSSGSGGKGGAGSSGSGGSGAGGSAGSSSASDGCGGGESSPTNDTAENATAYSPGTNLTACIETDADVDYYEVAAPAEDAAGGYYVLSVTEVGTCTIDLNAWVASDNTELGRFYNNSPGGSLFGYWLAAPGQKYRFSIAHFAGAHEPCEYTLRVEYNKVDDANEPDDTRNDATSITLGTSMNAYLFDGFEGGERSEDDYGDWYQFEASAGTISIKIEEVALDILPDIELFDSTGTAVGRKYNTTGGGSVTYEQVIETAGTYRFVVRVFSRIPEVLDRINTPTEVPESFTKPYKLTVSQL